ncbi:MAG: class I SAM-dependent methyltransferase [Candidatus Adlerbacteria bacterium]|nr:class I SAM-dependent methyltransferase [Candidatus Adlerbacteria bacterium]
MAEAFYSESFYEGMEDANLSSARIVVPLVFTCLQPKSVLDIGCGQGLWLKACMEQGVQDVVGYDGDYVDREKLSIPKENFVGVNLEEPLRLTKKFDLSVSLEVGEHLSDTASRTLVANLTDAAPVVLFSAAIPGQGGVHHINEQWPDYWEIRFKEKGYIPVDCLRRHVWDDKRVSFFYAQNILLYVKETELSKYPKLEEEIKMGHGHASALVHPQIYTYYESRWSKIAPLIWKVPLPLIKLGKKILSSKKST